MSVKFNKITNDFTEIRESIGGLVLGNIQIDRKYNDLFVDIRGMRFTTSEIRDLILTLQNII